MPQTILSDTDYRRMNTALGHIAETRDLLEAGKRAGLDVEIPLATLSALEYQIMEVKRAFFADRQ